MNRTKLYSHNLIGAACYQAIILVAGLITPRIFLVAYGSEINGLVTSINQFFAYFQLVEAGLSASLTYSLYKPLADKDLPAINGVVSASKQSYRQVGIMYSALTVILAALYPLFVHTESLPPSYIAALVVVLGLSGIIDFFSLAKSRVLLTADQRSYIISYSSALALVANTIIIIVLAQFRINVVILRSVALCSILLRSVILHVYVKKHYSFLDSRSKPNMGALSKRWDALFLQFLGAAQSGAPVILATIFTDLLSVSIYSIYNIVFGGIAGLLSIFTNGSPSSFGNVIARKEIVLLQKAYQEFELAFLSLITVVYITASFMIIPFIRLYTAGINDVNYVMPLIGILFALNGFLYHLKTPGGMLVIAAGLYRETRMQSMLQALIIVVFGIIFAPSFGLAGILTAGILSNLYRAIDLLSFIPKHVTHLPLRNGLLRSIRSVALYIIAILPMDFVTINPNSIAAWAAYTACVFIYACVLVLLVTLIFDRKYLIFLTQRIKHMLIRRQ